MLLCGLDENGLGPRLGPLVVTCVEARADGERAARVATSAPRGTLRARLGDSKALVSYGDSALGEAWARALAPGARTPRELLGALLADPEEALSARCPEAHAPQCWDASGEAFSADDAAVARARADLARLAARGVVVLRARVTLVCARALNEHAARGRSRFDVDLHAMERLVLAAREGAGEEVSATCGKVGGYDRYSPSFGPLGARLHVAVEEGRARSAYRFPGLGEIAFVRDADASNLLVGLASLVGKWARDLAMARVVRYHRAADAALPDASGYHDPTTARFVASSRLARAARGVPDECFERRRAEPAAPRPRVSGARPRARAASRASRPS